MPRINSIRMSSLCVVALGLAFAGCAQTPKRGAVAMKVSENEAHVSLGSGEVKSGDRVELFKNQCQRAKGAYTGLGVDPVCQKVRLGEGTVTRTLNSDYAVVQVDPGVSFDEKSVVEKKQR